MKGGYIQGGQKKKRPKVSNVLNIFRKQFELAEVAHFCQGYHLEHFFRMGWIFFLHLLFLLRKIFVRPLNFAEYFSDRSLNKFYTLLEAHLYEKM